MCHSVLRLRRCQGVQEENGVDNLRKEAAALLLKGAQTGKLFDPHHLKMSFFLQASPRLFQRVSETFFIEYFLRSYIHFSSILFV